MKQVGGNGSTKSVDMSARVAALDYLGVITTSLCKDSKKFPCSPANVSNVLQVWSLCNIFQLYHFLALLVLYSDWLNCSECLFCLNINQSLQVFSLSKLGFCRNSILCAWCFLVYCLIPTAVEMYYAFPGCQCGAQKYISGNNFSSLTEVGCFLNRI